MTETPETARIAPTVPPTDTPNTETPALARLPFPMPVVADLVCGAFSRPDIRKVAGCATPAYLAVLRALLDHLNARHNRVYPSQKRLSEKTGLCHSTIERAVAFFKKVGAILVLPDYLRRSPDAYPVNAYDLTPLLNLLPVGLQPQTALASGAFFSPAVPQNSGAKITPQARGSECSVVVSDSYTYKDKQQLPSEPHESSAEVAPQKPAHPPTPERTDAEEAVIVRAASTLMGFGVATNIAYDLAVEHGAERVADVARAARRAKESVSGGWLIAALRNGWAFVTKGEKYAASEGEPRTAAIPTRRNEPNPGDDAPTAALVSAPAPPDAPDPLDALTPEQYNALSAAAEADIRAANPVYRRMGGPRLPRPAVRDRMRKMLMSSVTTANIGVDSTTPNVADRT